jgi:cation diffusion facilitator CzcD-associated flavoprotein CzcO
LAGYLDMPMPADCPDYPGHEQVWAYLRSYAQRFDLYRHIEFSRSVQSVHKVVGGGNSACDIAVDLLPFAARTVLSMRRGTTCGRSSSWDARSTR